MFDVPALHPHAVRYAERHAAQNVIQKILVIVDPTAKAHPCIDKAARIASAFGSSIELFICDVDQTVPETWAGGTSLTAYRGLMRERRIAQLETLAEPLRARGLCVTTDSHWKAPLEAAIVERAIHTKVDLVVKDTHSHVSTSRSPTVQTDWVLIRQMPMPLLLVRPASWPSHPRICVAVDPCHPADRPEALDETMVANAASLGKALSADVELLHTLQSPPHLPGDEVSAGERDKAYAHARIAVERLAERVGIPPSAVHFLPEKIPDGILKLVDTAGADVLVMGCGARPRFQYSAASTASMVLEQVTCDVLVVKAPGFVSPAMVTEE